MAIGRAKRIRARNVARAVLDARRPPRPARDGQALIDLASNRRRLAAAIRADATGFSTEGAGWWTYDTIMAVAEAAAAPDAERRRIIADAIERGQRVPAKTTGAQAGADDSFVEGLRRLKEQCKAKTAAEEAVRKAERAVAKAYPDDDATMRRARLAYMAAADTGVNATDALLLALGKDDLRLAEKVWSKEALKRARTRAARAQRVAKGEGKS